MEDLQIHITELNQSVQLLLKQLNFIKKENNVLKQLVEKRDTELVEKNELINQLQQKYTAVSVTSNLKLDEKLQLHARIDNYLKEIEKCLELLNY